jgi:hypothetical protein
MRVHLTPSLVASALACLVAASCARLPATLRELTSPEERAIAAAREAFADAREPAPCELLDRAMIADLPHEELQDWCMSRAYGPDVESLGCVVDVYRTVLEPRRSIIYLSDRLEGDDRIRIVIHEASHIVRGCWAFDVRFGDPAIFAERYHRGEREGCEIAYPADHGHCDSEVWTTIASDAFARWSAAR